MAPKKHGGSSPTSPRSSKRTRRSNSVDAEAVNHLQITTPTLPSYHLNSNDASAQMPKIVVVGSRWSDKSSVLEAIMQVSFPFDELFMSWCFTHIILRHDLLPSVTVTINPDSRLRENLNDLRNYRRHTTDFSKLADLLQEATLFMSLAFIRNDEELYDECGMGDLELVRSCLIVEISGPDIPDLTLLDIPNLDEVPLPERDLEFFNDQVRILLAHSRNIILAVVSADYRWENNAILKWCHDQDPEGRRTLGTITRLDCIKGSADAVKYWINVALNKSQDNTLQLQLGWHLLKNLYLLSPISSEYAMLLILKSRPPTNIDFSWGELIVPMDFKSRNNSEAEFFEREDWLIIPTKDKGIEELRRKLANIT